MNSNNLNELLRAFKSGDYEKLEDVKDIVSPQDYEKAMDLYSQYGNKPETEILSELESLKYSVPNHQAIIENLKPFLNNEQLSKLNKVINFLDGND